MRIISRRNLIEFGVKHRDCKEALDQWYDVITSGTWNTPQDFKSSFPTCVILSSSRVIFHIKGNHYRLIVSVNYRGQRMYVKYVGTHAEYDKIDAHTISQF